MTVRMILVWGRAGAFLSVMALVVGCASTASTAGGSGGGGGSSGMASVAGMAAAGQVGEQCPSVSGGAPGGDPNAQATWSRPFTLEHWLTIDGWQGVVLTSAVDSGNRFLITDATSIYALDDAGIHVLLDKTALAADFGTTEFLIHALDTAPDGTLFVLIERTGAFSKEIYRLASDGHLGRFADLTAYWQLADRFSVVNNELLLLPVGSLLCVTPTVTATLYDSSTPIWSMGCNQEIAAEPSGVFYYLPGCNQTPLYTGDAKASGIKVLSTWSAVNAPSGSFAMVARAPRGGAIVDAESGFHYFDESGRHIALTVTPPIPEVSNIGTAQRTDFAYCTHAVGTNDSIFIACDGHAYRITPTK